VQPFKSIGRRTTGRRTGSADDPAVMTESWAIGRVSLLTETSKENTSIRSVARSALPLVWPKENRVRHAD
jgi:hypothetical protein